MLVTHFQSSRVVVGTAAYHAAMDQAEQRAQELRSVGKGGCVRWDDEYNDYSAVGRFVVTGR